MNSKTITYISELLIQKFEKNLVSAIVFGSSLTSSKPNDIDVLVICKIIPKNWRKQNELCLDLETKALQHAYNLHMTLIDTDSFKYSIKNGAPLLFNIYQNNNIIFDRYEFFQKQLKIFHKNIIKWKANKIDNCSWSVPAFAI